MSKSNSLLAQVPPHVFESMLRGNLASGNTLENWKDELQHWAYSSSQLDQLTAELKTVSDDVLDKKLASDIIEFIDKKIRE